MSEQAFVEFLKVEKTYDGRSLVVENLNLSIGQGEFLTLLGPSGSGKTTSLMMLAGFENPTSGEIHLGGGPIHNVPPHKRNIGMVFQNYALFPHMTVAENLAYPLSVRRIRQADRAKRVERALDMVRMLPFASRKPAQLSGGQQQRVALARALVFEPDLVLMDEPLGALDKNLREHMQLEIKHLHQKLGVTVVYVTHDQSEALTMSDRIAVFNRGRIEQLASPTQLYESPKTPFVAGFIGENNTLYGTITGRNGDHCEIKLDAEATSVRAKTSAALSPGSRIVLSVRPERLRLCVAPSDSLRGIPAKISELIFLGDHIRVHVTIRSGSIIVAKIPNTPDRQVLEVGETCHVVWNDGDGIVLPAA